ncbi:MAG: hypothetical protein ACE5ID_04940 [Acidobacteriota bacterium]
MNRASERKAGERQKREDREPYESPALKKHNNLVDITTVILNTFTVFG